MWFGNITGLISSNAVGIAATFPYSERTGFLINVTDINLLSYAFPDKVKTARKACHIFGVTI